MLNNHKIKFLLKEITRLKNEETIDEATHQKLTDYYVNKISPRNIAKLIIISISIFASLLIIGGLTLVIVTFNWHIFTKEVKTVLAYIFLLIPQILCLYQLIKGSDNMRKKETFSLVLTLFFGISIAFIAQIYKLPENTESFLLLWLISTIAITYLFNSISSVVVYLVLLISYTSVLQYNGKIGLFFYPLLALLIPFYIIEYKKRSLLRIKLFDYLLIITLISGLGITLEKVVPGLWIVAYSNLFVVFYLYGATLEKSDGLSLFYSPFKISGIFGIAVLGYMFTFHWPWQEIGWEYYRTAERFNFAASFFDYFLCIILPLISGFLIYISINRKKSINYILSGFGILNIIIYILVSSLSKSKMETYILPAVFMNLFIIAYCFYFFYLGYKNKSLVTVNASTILLLTVLITRFFDFDMSALSRGFAFIILGLILVFINIILSKKFKRL